MKRALLLSTSMLLGAIALPVAAGEPTADALRSDPMYQVVFGGRDRVASIRAPAEPADHLSATAEDWPEVAVQWHPRAVPLVPDLSR